MDAKKNHHNIPNLRDIRFEGDNRYLEGDGEQEVIRRSIQNYADNQTEEGMVEEYNPHHGDQHVDR